MNTLPDLDRALRREFQALSTAWRGRAWFQVVRRAKFRCEYCDADVLASVDTIYSTVNEHIVPVARGGSKDDLNNLALSCAACNTLKGRWVPSGDDRAARIACVRRHLAELRALKHPVLLRVRGAMGLC